MLGVINYHNPTRLHFGKEALDSLKSELALFGKNVMLSYGGGSIKKTGLYDRVVQILKECGKEIFEDPGVMPNPTIEKLEEGCEIVRKNNVDLILAVGGGSVCDYAKGVSAAAYCGCDPWEKFYAKKEDPDQKTIPVGCILTMVGTGSEMNGGSVISNHKEDQKVGKVFGPELFPKFSILNPELTFTVPKYQMVSGIFDIMSHILEQYLSGEDDNTSDYILEGLMHSLIHSSKIAVKNPTDYEARSNIMWTSTWALNTFAGQGKAQDWTVHMIGQAISAVTDATHGMTLSAVSIPYFKKILDAGLQKFVRLAKNVWGVSSEGKTDREVAEEGLSKMSEWMNEIGVVMHSAELGVTEENIERIVNSTSGVGNGYKKINRDEIIEILRESL